MSPKAGCKTCARIPIHYPNVTDGANNGGILKVDYKSQDNCIGTCVGPHSFNLATTPTTTTTSVATTTSTTTATSAGKRLEAPGHFEGLWVLTIMAMAALLGFFSVQCAIPN
jgi:hypothetical protein